MLLELLSLLCAFENSTKCSKISFDSDSFLEQLTGLLQCNTMHIGKFPRHCLERSPLFTKLSNCTRPWSEKGKFTVN